LDSIKINWVTRPWGRYTVVYEAPGVWIKTLIISPWSRLSLQTHAERTEVWHCPEGRLEAVIGDEEVFLTPDRSFLVPLGTPHRIINNGRYEETLIEIALGNPYEEDIVRLDDDYGRSER
jgi:mannose-6-phosphate isomerase-like protein (cupin superfamily)